MTLRAWLVAGLLVGAAGGARADDAVLPAWLPSVIDRSYVMPGGGVAVYGDFGVEHFSVGSPTPVAGTAEGLHAGLAYSITDVAAAGIEYSLPFAGDSDHKGEGPLTFYGMYSVVHDANLTVAATADFVLDFAAAGGTTKVLEAGVGARYAVAPMVALFTGAPLGPGPVGRQLSVGLQSDGPITFTLPVGVGLQATPNAFVSLSTELFAVAIANSKFADASPQMPLGTKRFVVLGSENVGVPVEVAGWLWMNPHLDIGAVLSDDLKHPGDKYAVAFGLRWYR